MEEDLFPSRQSKDEPHLMDEERRLCYVGMTRAMKKLNLSYADKRFLHGQSFYSMPSRFLDEVPSAFLNRLKSPHKDYSYSESSEPYSNRKTMVASTNSPYSIGQTVKHAKFGFGTILNYEGSGDGARVQVKFSKAGTKWLITSYANLEIA
jgi:DNA helicase-2/ATP-dependent DNA helicase PcrA